MGQTVALGGTAHLSVNYEDGEGTFVDPVTPLVSVIRPDTLTEVGGVTPTQQAVGIYTYDFVVPSTAQLGDWIGRFTGTINGLNVSGDDLFTVVSAGSVGPGDNLMTLTELREAMGVDPDDHTNDVKWQLWLDYVSDLIRVYTGRAFGLDVATEDRAFEYDGSGYLDIDDATDITAVALSYPYSTAADILLGPNEWRPKPDRRVDSPTYQYILLPGYQGAILGSSVMGFRSNLDSYGRTVPLTVTVSGTWGYRIVPGDVRMAVVWSVQDWQSRPEGESMVAEAIEGWSRSWGTRGESSAAMALPRRALDVLAGYAKIPT